ESGGDGLLANPRSRPTPLSAFRTPTSESVVWLLLLFATEKQLKKKKFSARRPKIAKGVRENFCCLRHRKAEKKEKISDALFRKMQSGFVEGGTQKRGKEKKRFTMKHKKACRKIRQTFRCDGNRSRSV
ncbi:hypothetical protein, partial [uncultured Alistipes sp.]|uniref:hypothetical protein n=1 Tax=uncultured Alistipes sp. TaxID=538949 RepID=UPI002665E042